MNKKIFLLTLLLTISGVSFVLAQGRFGNAQNSFFPGLLSLIFGRTAPVSERQTADFNSWRLPQSSVANQISPFLEQPSSCPSCGLGTKIMNGKCLPDWCGDPINNRVCHEGTACIACEGGSGRVIFICARTGVIC